MLGRSLFCIVLLLAVLNFCVNAAPQTRNAPGEKVSTHRIILHSPIPLTPTERRELNARIREFGSDMAEELVRQAYQDGGYFKAEVSAELVGIRTPGVNANTLVIQVSPGKQYRLIRISWRGVTVFSESELANLIPVRPGQLFNRTQIAEGLNAARKLYDSRGYLNYTCVPTPEVDDEAATVAFEMDVDEGGRFHFGELDVVGMEEAHSKILLSAWEGLRGRPYNGEDADKFFNRFFRSPLPDIKPENYTIRHFDEKNRSVNYSLRFAPSLRYRVSRNSQLELVERP